LKHSDETRKPGMKFLCFDIETTGLDATRDEVTMICTEDLATGERKSYNFGVLSRQDKSADALVAQVVADFDEADALCAFNGIRFDLPFMQQALSIHDDVITQWVLKTVDPLEYLRLSGHRTSSLDKICTHNNITSKSSTGLHAIEMANEERWDELEQYCQQDVTILCVLVKLRKFQHPAEEKLIDLAECMPDGMYDSL
jgi:DNA polymerase III alpha subunit (gram-positive type)